MIITSIKTRGQNVFVGTDADKSFVINGALIPLMLNMEIVEDGSTVTINGQAFNQTFNEHNNVWELTDAS